jgi:hypothetical protein
MRKWCKVFILTFASACLALVGSTSISMSRPVEVYGADNCDATSFCTIIDEGDSNTQKTDCKDGSACLAVSVGDSNTQKINCKDGSGCAVGGGDSNTQKTNCDSSQCVATAEGDSNTQKTNCKDGSGCTVIAEGDSNTQKTICKSSICENTGPDTKIIANSATNTCSSGDAGITKCKGDDVTFKPKS